MLCRPLVPTEVTSAWRGTTLPSVGRRPMIRTLERDLEGDLDIYPAG